MDIEQTAGQQVLAEAKKQTKALELLVALAQTWSVLAGIGLVILLITLFASRS